MAGLQLLRNTSEPRKGRHYMLQTCHCVCPFARPIPNKEPGTPLNNSRHALLGSDLSRAWRVVETARYTRTTASQDGKHTAHSRRRKKKTKKRVNAVDGYRECHVRALFRRMTWTRREFVSHAPAMPFHLSTGARCARQQMNRSTRLLGLSRTKTKSPKQNRPVGN